MRPNKTVIAFAGMVTIIIIVFCMGAVSALRGSASAEDGRETQLLRNIFSTISTFLTSLPQYLIDFIVFIFNAIIGGFFFFVSSITRTTATTTSPPTSLMTSSSMTTIMMASTTPGVSTQSSTESVPVTTTSAAAVSTSSTTATIGTTSTTSSTTLPSPPGPKRVFLTSTKYNGNLGGIEGADSICNSLAMAEGLGGTFAAWISNATVSPSMRFVNTSFPYILLNNETFATSFQSLLDNGPLTLLTVSEASDEITETVFVWTNTANTGGVRAGNIDCNGWTSSNTTGDGVVGAADLPGTWSELGALPCSQEASLYCFQQ